MLWADYKLFSFPMIWLLTINIDGIDGLVILADLQCKTQAACLEVTRLEGQDWLNTVPGAPLL